MLGACCSKPGSPRGPGAAPFPASAGSGWEALWYFGESSPRGHVSRTGQRKGTGKRVSQGGWPSWVLLYPREMSLLVPWDGSPQFLCVHFTLTYMCSGQKLKAAHGTGWNRSEGTAGLQINGWQPQRLWKPHLPLIPPPRFFLSTCLLASLPHSQNCLPLSPSTHQLLLGHHCKGIYVSSSQISRIMKYQL